MVSLSEKMLAIYNHYGELQIRFDGGLYNFVNHNITDKSFEKMIDAAYTVVVNEDNKVRYSWKDLNELLDKLKVKKENGKPYTREEVANVLKQ